MFDTVFRVHSIHTFLGVKGIIDGDNVSTKRDSSGRIGCRPRRPSHRILVDWSVLLSGYNKYLSNHDIKTCFTFTWRRRVLGARLHQDFSPLFPFNFPSWNTPCEIVSATYFFLHRVRISYISEFSSPLTEQTDNYLELPSSNRTVPVPVEYFGTRN